MDDNELTKLKKEVPDFETLDEYIEYEQEMKRLTKKHNMGEALKKLEKKFGNK